MAFDLILRNGRLGSTHTTPNPNGPLADIGISEGRIAAIGPQLSAEGAESLDLDGALVTTGIVESHIHLDKSRILDRATPSPNRGRDHMARVSAVKPGFTEEDVYRRASTTLEACISHGATHMRTHVEVDPNVGMVSFNALKRLAEDYRWAIDLELCVFAQEGMSNVPETDANVVNALQQGAQTVGGAPGYDPDHAAQIKRVFELAREYDVDVDLHLDVGPDAEDMDIPLVLELTEQYGYGGRVAVGHGTRYSSLPVQELEKLGRRMADAGVTLTVLPATDLFVMGRQSDHNIVRGVTDANTLSGVGVNCCLSTNNVLNPFTPFGDGSLVRVANLYANVVQRGMWEEQAEIFQMLTNHPAKLLGLQDYGLAPGKSADLVVWEAPSTAETVATIAPARFGFKRGRRTFTRPGVNLHRT